jgi:hypothetical protein
MVHVAFPSRIILIFVDNIITADKSVICTTAMLVKIGDLKALSHEIFTVIFMLEWIYLGLNGNRFWCLNFKEGSLILDSYFKY